MSAPTRVNVVVVGDRAVGKTSLITTAAQDVFSESPVPVVQLTRFPSDFYPEPVELLVHDTSSKPEDQQHLEDTIRGADALVLCFDAHRRNTLERLRSHWMPELQRLKPGTPVVIVCCKADTDDTGPIEQMRDFLEALIAQYPCIEVSLRTSARHLKNVKDAFYHSIKVVLYPKAPLLDASTGRLTTACVKALLRIFLMCDADGDGALNDMELNTFQYLCFGAPLTHEELASVRQMVAERMADDGLNDRGLLFPGFMYLHTLFLTRGRLESTWTVLKMFGYNESLRISDAVLDRLRYDLPPDQVLELSEEALSCLAHIFAMYDSSRTGLLSLMDLEHMFNRDPLPVYQSELWCSIMVSGASTTTLFGSAAASAASSASSPVDGASAGPNSTIAAVEAARRASASGGLTREGYLAKWHAYALADPRSALEHMLYLGMGGRAGEGAGELFAVRPRRRSDKRHDLTTRATVNCYVFGAAGVGKSGLIKALAGRRLDDGPSSSSAATASANSAAAAGAGAAGAAPGSRAAGVGGEGGGEGGDALARAGVLAAHESMGLLASGHVLVDGEPRALVLTEASSSATPTDPGVDLSRADVAVFVFDAADPASFEAAHKLLTGISDAANNTLPCVLVAAKDDLGLSNELVAHVSQVCRELALPEPTQVSALLGQMGGNGRTNVFGVIAEAGIHPERHLPETPAKKARRLAIRRAWIYTGVGITTALSAYAAYRLYRAPTSRHDTSSTGTSGSNSTASTNAKLQGAPSASSASPGGALSQLRSKW